MPDFVQKSELQRLWQSGRGKKCLIENVNELVNHIVIREAEKLIHENKHLAKKPSKFDDEIEEIEDLEDFNSSGKGFHFNNRPAITKSTAVQPLSNKKPVVLNAVTPLNIEPKGRDSKTYSKKIGFADEFDDDWDESSRKHGDDPKQ